MKKIKFIKNIKLYSLAAISTLYFVEHSKQNEWHHFHHHENYPNADGMSNVTRNTDHAHRDRDKNMPDWNARYEKYGYGDYGIDPLLNQTHRKDMKINMSAMDTGPMFKSTPPTLSNVVGLSQRAYDIDRNSNNAVPKQTTNDKYSTTEHMKVADKNVVVASSPIATESHDTVASNWTTNPINTINADIYSDVDTNEISDNSQQIAQNISEYAWNMQSCMSSSMLLTRIIRFFSHYRQIE